MFYEKKYLEWPEYINRISNMEILTFLPKTSQINNKAGA